MVVVIIWHRLDNIHSLAEDRLFGGSRMSRRQTADEQKVVAPPADSDSRPPMNQRVDELLPTAGRLSLLPGIGLIIMKLYSFT